MVQLEFQENIKKLMVLSDNIFISKPLYIPHYVTKF